MDIGGMAGWGWMDMFVTMGAASGVGVAGASLRMAGGC